MHELTLGRARVKKCSLGAAVEDAVHGAFSW